MISLIENIINELGGRSSLTFKLQETLKWLEKSFKVTQYLGSSAYRTSFGTWGPAYPETTGYLLPTLIKASQTLDVNQWQDLALSQIQYFEKIQLSHGAFPVNQNELAPNVFDTSQILLGMVKASRLSNTDVFKSLIEKSYFWLQSQINEEGQFLKYNLYEGYNPAYYSRIVWALLEAEKYLEIQVSEKTLILFKSVLELFNNDFQVRDTAFYPEQDCYSHTLAYAIRGFIESTILLQMDNTKVRSILESLTEHIFKNNSLAGKYDGAYLGDYKFICATGHCQVALLLMKHASLNSHPKLEQSIVLLLKAIINSPRKNLWNTGALPSSIPVFRDYQRLKYTNWTQKFFCDVLVALLNPDLVES